MRTRSACLLIISCPLISAPPFPLDILNWHLSKQSVGCEVALEFTEALRKELKVCVEGNWMSKYRL